VTGNKTYVPGAEVLNKILKVQITASESAPSDPETAPMAESAPAAAPVLPPRADFEAGYHIPGQSKRWGDAYMYCADRNERLATEPELIDFYLAYTRANVKGDDSGNDLQGTYGATIAASWSSLWKSEGAHARIHFTDGHGIITPDVNANEFLCARFGGSEGRPSVTNVQIPAGQPVVGTALTATYTYSGNATIPDRSRFQWFSATDAAGTGKTAIEGATTVTYTPVVADAGKWLIVDVTPASYDTVVGTVVSDTSDAAVLQTAAPDATQSTLTADKASIAGDGAEVGTFTVSINDASGNPLPGLDVTSIHSTEDDGVATWTDVTDHGDGTYSQGFTGNAAGRVTAAGVVIDGTILPLTPVSIAILGAPSAATSIVTVSKKAMKGNGVDTNTATATIKDSAGNVLLGRQVEFQKDGGDWDNTVEQGNGVYTASFTGNAGGALYSGKVIGVVVDGVVLNTPDIAVDFYPVRNSRFDFDTGAGGDGWNMEGEQNHEGLGFYVGAWLSGAGNGTDTRPQQNGNVTIPERNIIAVKVQTNGRRFSAVVVTYSDNTQRLVGIDDGGSWQGYMPSDARDMYIGYVKGINGNEITRLEFNLK
jgi:hypothetical protein